MMLVVDVGNSRIKWRRVGAQSVSAASKSISRPSEATQLAACLDTVWGADAAPSRVVVGSVVGADFERVLAKWIDKTWAVETQFLRSVARGWGVTNDYPEPGALGVDRWAVLVAARRHHAGNVIVVDCGTALTVDALDTHGCHVGGVIVPGIELMKRCLLDNTAKIFDSESAGGVDFADNTGGAVRSGVVLALAGLVEKMTGMLQQRSDEAPTTLLTGGGAESLQPVLALDVIVYEDMVLDGLTIMAESTA